ncbi:hypothetical protein A2U01_0089302, partial [Trifolium medium]|nr:hypothetical protein [Trifolium medium]
AHQESQGAISAICASRRCAGVLRAVAEDGLEKLYELRVAQENMARRAGQQGWSIR